jgi:ribonuclease P protein component
MLKSINRLKKRKEFNYVYKKGEIAHSNLFTMHFVKTYRKYAQIGISVSKQVGNSVVRSRVKRIISEACRLNINKFAVKNYVITAKESIKDKLSTDVEQELLRVLKKHNLIKEENNV